MGKRYYCDYCDRSFKDDFDARKKHVSGSMHMRARMEHYNAFKDAETIVTEESAKITCKRFMQVGECSFGVNCRFTHYRPQELDQLRCQIEEEKKLKLLQLESSPIQTKFTSSYQKISDIGQDITNIRACGSSMNESQNNKPLPFPNWQVSSSFQSYNNLPPSLKPMNFQLHDDFRFEEWG